MEKYYVFIKNVKHVFPKKHLTPIIAQCNSAKRWTTRVSYQGNRSFLE